MIALDQALGQVLFGDIYPDETISAYVWRTQKTDWIKRVDRFFGDGHCRTSYEHSMDHLFDALEYRP